MSVFKFDANAIKNIDHSDYKFLVLEGADKSNLSFTRSEDHLIISSADMKSELKLNHYFSDYVQQLVAPSIVIGSSQEVMNVSAVENLTATIPGSDQRDSNITTATESFKQDSQPIDNQNINNIGDGGNGNSRAHVQFADYTFNPNSDITYDMASSGISGSNIHLAMDKINGSDAASNVSAGNSGLESNVNGGNVGFNPEREQESATVEPERENNEGNDSSNLDNSSDPSDLNNNDIDAELESGTGSSNEPSGPTVSIGDQILNNDTGIVDSTDMNHSDSSEDDSYHLNFSVNDLKGRDVDKISIDTGNSDMGNSSLKDISMTIEYASGYVININSYNYKFYLDFDSNENGEVILDLKPQYQTNISNIEVENLSIDLIEGSADDFDISIDVFDTDGSIITSGTGTIDVTESIEPLGVNVNSNANQDLPVDASTNVDFNATEISAININSEGSLSNTAQEVDLSALSHNID